MNKLRAILLPLSPAWQAGYPAQVRRAALAFILLAAGSCGACLLLPELRSFLLDQVLHLTGSPQPSTSFAELFTGNLRACTVTMLYGLLPFLQLSALSLGVNAMLVGILSAHSIVSGPSLWAFLAGTLPHSLMELPALVLAVAMGLLACQQVTRRIRGDRSALSVWDCLAQMGSLLMLLIPLLAAAALVEAWVSPMLLAWVS